MTSNYPTSLDSLPDIASSDLEDDIGKYHDEQHDNANDILEAIEAKVGVDNSTVTSSIDYRIRNLDEYPPATGSEDDDFNDGSFSGWTTVEGGEALTITEARGRASVLHPGGGASAKFSARMKAHTFATNDWIEAAFRYGSHIALNYPFMGLTMSNGTTHGTSNAVHFGIRADSGTTMQWFKMANTGFTGDTSRTEASFSAHQYPEFFMRWKYEGSNTFRGYVSPDGITWRDATGSTTYTLTPTHVGFSISTWGSSTPCVMSLAYFRLGNG